MEPLLRNLRIWAASVRYSVTRQMMFRGDFLIWLVTDFLWIAVNVLAIEVVYRHTDGIAGWSKHELMLLLGTAILQQRLFMGLFFTGFHEMGRSIRAGTFDFFIAQPGSVLFLVSTRRLELDGITNTLVAGALVLHACNQLGLEPTALQIGLYLACTLCGVGILYGIMSALASITFWAIKAEGAENGFFTLTEFARLPRQAYSGVAAVIIGGSVIVMSSNLPANLLRGTLSPAGAGWMLLAAVGSILLGALVFRFGLRRYTSASS